MVHLRQRRREHPHLARTGTLVVEVKPFRSDRELPAKAVEQLKSGGLEWGLRDEKIVAVIDATHPYADQMSAHAVAACGQAAG